MNKYTEEQIAQVLERNEKGESIPNLAKELGVDTSTIYKWRAHPPEAAKAGCVVSATPAKAGEGEFISGLIATPSGNYKPKSDNIMDELRSAAQESQLAKFKIFINGTQIKSEAQLREICPTLSLKDQRQAPRVEGVEAGVRIERYDKAG